MVSNCGRYSKLVHILPTWTKVRMGMALPQCREAVRAKPTGGVPCLILSPINLEDPWGCSWGAGNGYNRNYGYNPIGQL